MGSSIWDYVGSAAYTSIGQPEQYNMGPSAGSASLTYTYEEGTGRLRSSTLAAGTTPVTLDNATYTYSNAGTIQNEADTPSGAPPQVQCFSYDYLGRLSQAWAQGSTGCVPAMSQSAESGAAAPYWDQYSYDTSGDLTGVTSTPATGAATTDTSVFPAAGQPQAHGLMAQQSAGPGGSTVTSYGYDADGDTTSIAGPSSSQSLSWNDAGQLASDTVTGSGAGATGYVYDAGGNLLLQSDPSSLTLYLPDEQVVYNTATQAVTATRYYSINGQVTAARRTGGTVTYLDSSQQGTATVAVDSQSLAPTRRYYDPYGSPVGTPPPAWPGTRGFVGGTADQATGLTNLGAREYNPATGSFISPDPKLQPGNPQDLDAYAYAQDDPASNADPSGLMVPGQSYAVNPGPGPISAPGPAPAHQPASPPLYTFLGGGSCGICGSSSYGLAFNKNAFTPSATPVRTRTNHLLFPGLAAIAPACAVSTFGATMCVNTLWPVAPAVRRTPLPKVSPDELQGLIIIITMLEPLADILDLGIDAAAAGAGSDAAAGDAGDAGGAGIRNVPEGTEPVPVRTVFRADTRGPKEIFSRGFKPKGSNMDLWQHVDDNPDLPDDSGFVATSSSKGSAEDFAEQINADYIYKVRASGYDVNATFGVKSPFPYENEIAVPGAISPANIEGVWGPQGWVANPGFRP